MGNPVPNMAWPAIGLSLVAWLTGAHVVAQEKQTARPYKANQAHEAEQRGLRFLATEVQRWSPENKCYSCHNNGDGARVLFLARRAGHAVPPPSMAATTAWLSTPEQWHTNGPNEPFNDLKLARIQFFHALGEATRANLVADVRLLERAADLVVADQISSGAWDFVGADEIGSPVTYGRELATASVARTLRLTKAERFAPPMARADAWLRSASPKSVLNAAAVCWGLGAAQDPAAAAQRKQCLSIMLRGESPDGGFGPYVDAAPEPFDTAIVLCALHETNDRDFNPLIRRSREYLRRSQLSDGSWPETTRPALRESYAQRISTTAWAVQALMATRKTEE